MTFAVQVGAFAKLGITVVLSFALLWIPYLSSKERFFDVLQRLAPLGRGLFEDYVANFWCVSSLIIKWKRLFSQQVKFPVCKLPKRHDTSTSTGAWKDGLLQNFIFYSLTKTSSSFCIALMDSTEAPSIRF